MYGLNILSESWCFNPAAPPVVLLKNLSTNTKYKKALSKTDSTTQVYKYILQQRACKVVFGGLVHCSNIWTPKQRLLN